MLQYQIYKKKYGPQNGLVSIDLGFFFGKCFEVFKSLEAHYYFVQSCSEPMVAEMTSV